MRCESCGAEFAGAPGDPCPQCGVTTATGPDSGGGALAAGAAPPPPPPDGPPWERQRSLGAMMETIKGVLIEPSRTFAEASRTAGIGPALGFAMILGMIGGYVNLFWKSLTQAAFLESLGALGELPPELEQFENFLGDFAGPASSILGIVSVPLQVLISVFVWAAVVHLLLLLFGGAMHGFEATFRTTAYAYGTTSLFLLVPFCGWIVGFIWLLVVQIIGLKEIHGITTGKAAAAVLLPFFLCCCALAGLFFMVLALIINAGGGGF